MFELKVKTHFAAAHQLTMVGRKCENLHGHNWNIEVYVCGDALNSAGVLADFGDIKKAVKQIILQLDHKYLNELTAFSNEQPTSERIAIYIASELKPLLNDLNDTLKVSRITAWESEDACATYYPE